MQLGFSQSTSTLRIIALTTLLFAMTACGHSNIDGKWRMSGSGNQTVWEFSNNGSVLVGDIRGRYKFGDQDRIKIETPFATSVYQLDISSDQMTLQEPGGTTLEFTRVKETQH